MAFPFLNVNFTKKHVYIITRLVKAYFNIAVSSVFAKVGEWYLTREGMIIDLYGKHNEINAHMGN